MERKKVTMDCSVKRWIGETGQFIERSLFGGYEQIIDSLKGAL